MKISLQLINQGEQRVFLQPVAETGKEEYSEFILIRCMAELESPVMRLKLNEQHSFDIVDKNGVDEKESSLQEKLNALAIDVVEAIQQGRDLAAEDIPETAEVVTPYDPELIRVESSTMSLRQVNDMIKDGDINLSPDFQRNAVWDYQRKCRLIESILLRIPLPVFYFSSSTRGELSVVDGLQRLTAIKEFMNNELPLHGLEYLNEYDGCTYNGKKPLNDRLYRRFNLTQIAVNVIDSSSPTKVKYDIFRRLNTGGRPLNSQELRNCLSTKELREALKAMAHSEEFLTATTKSVSDERMDAQEYALRFMYFRYLYKTEGRSIEDYSGAMDNDLDEFVDFLTRQESFPYNEYISEFRKSMNNAIYLFGRHAFRKVYANTEYESYRSVINKTLFLSWSVLLADIDINVVNNKIDEHSWIYILGKHISEDEHFFSMLSYGTNGWKNIMVAFDNARQIINEQIGN